MNLRVLLVALALALPGFAQPPPGAWTYRTPHVVASRSGFSRPPPQDRTYRLRTEWLVASVPTETALRLVPALRDPETAPQAVAEIEGMIATGTATLHGRPVLWSRSGERAKSECVEEVLYPTNFDMAGMSVPQDFGNSPALQVPAAPPRILSSYPGLDTPEAFEMRNLGLTLEIEPVVSPDGQFIDVNIATRHDTLERWDRILDAKTGTAPDVYAQPQFRAFTLTTSLLVASGSWNLLGVYVVAKPTARVELSLLRVTAIPAK